MSDGPIEQRSEPPTNAARNHNAVEAEHQIGPDQPRRRRWPIVIIAVVVLAVIGAALWYFKPWSNAITTDDAFIDGDVSQVSGRVAGQVQRVLVTDNQQVQAGDVLVELDPRDLQAAVDQAQANLMLAQAELQAAESNVALTQATTAAELEQAQAQVQAAQALTEQSQAQLAAAESERQRAEADLQRYEQLEAPAVSQQQRDVVRAAAQRAVADVEAAQRAVAAAQAQTVVAQARYVAAQAGEFQVRTAQSQQRRAAAAVEQAQAALREAMLRRSYAAIVAPVAGRVTNRAVEPGNYIQPGQALMAIVSSALWVTANYKETQITNMRPGDRAIIEVDAFPHQNFAGHVDSLQAGSGAFFSLLPPENATGNYVKVVQRVPVKIVFDETVDLARFPLGPGMSAVPKVYPGERNSAR